MKETNITLRTVDVVKRNLQIKFNLEFIIVRTIIAKIKMLKGVVTTQKYAGFVHHYTN